MAPSISESRTPSSPTSKNGDGGPVVSTSNSASTSQQQHQSLYKIASIPGKGKSLIALQKITPGTLILSEAPLITTDVILSGETIESDLARALKSLPRDSQRAFLSLHNNYPGQGTPLQNIIRSNGYPLGASSDVGGVFENISRINHSCLPNAVHSWNASRGQETVYAVRDINEGEEVTLSYLAGGPSSSRKAQLKDNFGFECRCELCSLPSKLLQASDARLIRAANLDATIGDSQTVKNSPGKVLKNCKNLSRIFAEEGVRDDRLSRLWYDCFQVCNFHSDEARASVFLGRYCDVKRISAGVDGTDVSEMEGFVGRPRSHDSFGLRSGWKSEVGDVPRELGEAEFEKWLWRE